MFAATVALIHFSCTIYLTGEWSCHVPSLHHSLRGDPLLPRVGFPLGVGTVMVQILHAHLKLVPEDFFRVELSKDNFLVPCLSALLQVQWEFMSFRE